MTSDDNRQHSRALAPGGHIEYAGYKIVKRSPEGVYVLKGGTNPMPGATWFHNERDAQAGIDILEAVGGNGRRFWHLLRALQWAKGE